MKNLTKLFIPLLGIVSMFSFGGCSSSKKAVSNSSTVRPAENSVAPASALGKWNYIVTGLPDGDIKGDMQISQTGNILKGILTNSGIKTEIKNLKIVNETLTGTFDYNGMSININGKFNGGAFTGNVETQGYSFPFKATKKI